MFWTKKVDNSTEITQIQVKIRGLETQFDDLVQKYRSLRGLVNKKIGYVSEDDEEDIDKPSKKEKSETNIKSSIFLSPDGNLI